MFPFSNSQVRRKASERHKRQSHKICVRMHLKLSIVNAVLWSFMPCGKQSVIYATFMFGRLWSAFHMCAHFETQSVARMTVR